MREKQRFLFTTAHYSFHGRTVVKEEVLVDRKQKRIAARLKKRCHHTGFVIRRTIVWENLKIGQTGMC